VETTFIRFVVDKLDRDSGRRLGVFQVVSQLLRDGALDPIERDQLEEQWRWFVDKLDAPDRFARSRKSNAAPRAISWFKSSAREHVSRMRLMVNVLRHQGIPVSELLSSRVGYVVFADEHQVAAEPFADTPT
jgi:hypothetical protein